MSEECQSPAQPQTCPCLAIESHHLDPNPWTPKSCCALTVSLGFLKPWTESHRVIASGHKTANPPREPAVPWALISEQCWPFTQLQDLKSIPVLHSGLWGLSEAASSLLYHSPFLDCCPCSLLTETVARYTQPAHSPESHLSPPGPPVMLQQGQSPPPHSHALLSHGPCKATTTCVPTSHPILSPSLSPGRCLLSGDGAALCAPLGQPHGELS